MIKDINFNYNEKKNEIDFDTNKNLKKETDIIRERLGRKNETERRGSQNRRKTLNIVIKDGRVDED